MMGKTTAVLISFVPFSAWFWFSDLYFFCFDFVSLVSSILKPKSDILIDQLKGDDMTVLC